ncbi:borealin [Aplochiton taeniatus]
MAPRKRTTKQRKNNPKMNKLEAFLEDFDSEVKTTVERLKEKRNKLLKDADTSYNMALIKLPKAVRQMNWLEQSMSEKPKSPPVEDAKKEEDAAKVESVLAEVHTFAPKSAKKSLKKQRGTRTTSSEDEENTVPNTVKNGKATRKPASTSRRAKALSVSKQGTAVRKSSKKPLLTPARNMLDSSLMGPTPLITPRFDSRLPKTPLVRIPRHKERVYSISVNGSPIAAGSNDIVINVPSGNGECIQLLASQMDSVDLSLLNETALKSIRQLQVPFYRFLTHNL